MTDQHKCAERIWDGRFGNYACSRNGAYEHEGKHYCKTHYPPNVAAKRAAKSAAYDAKWARERSMRMQVANEAAEQKRRADLYPELLLACEGLLSIAETGVMSLGAVRAARATISKAKGAA